MSDEIPITKEAELCEAFIRSMNKVPGWTCYPEAAGFDILVVHESGRQIGVEAKLTLNAKVVDQILPHDYELFYGTPGPDHRLIIVAKLTDASRGVSRLLHTLGIPVLVPRWGYSGVVAGSGVMAGSWGFDLEYQCNLGDSRRYFGNAESLHLHDWNPAERCQVPMVVGCHKAGVPSPIRLTPWKESALKVIALMRKQGFITAKQIQQQGISPTAWTRSNGPKESWLGRGATRGSWVETPHMPAFDKQHPEAYALATAAVTEEFPAELKLA